MRATPAIDVVCDASVVLQWFRAEGERDVDAARDLVTAHREGRILAKVIDLTPYEVGNALMRGRAGASAAATSTVLRSLASICDAIAPDATDLAHASELVEAHNLTFYEAVYASVAARRGAVLASADRELLEAGLAKTPSAVMEELRLNDQVVD